jgi:signal transduction histidine kinase
VDPTDPSVGPAAARSELQRLIASIAHDIRNSVASIVYSADFLELRGADLSDDTWRESVHDICDASRRLQLTVDGLLDFARLGPTISVPVALRDVLSRAHALLRSLYRDGAHHLEVQVSPEAGWVRGNPLVIEQIFVNLLLHAAECAPGARHVLVSASVAEPLSSGERMIVVRVSDDRGTPDQPHSTIFESNAREAALGQDGQLFLEQTSSGASFILLLPRSEGPR